MAHTWPGTKSTKLKKKAVCPRCRLQIEWSAENTATFEFSKWWSICQDPLRMSPILCLWSEKSDREPPYI